MGTVATPELLKRGGARAARVLFRLVLLALFAILVLLAVGGAVGRIRLAPAPDRVTGTSYVSSDLVVVVPVPVQKLRVDDVIIVSNAEEKALLRIDDVVDSTGPQVHVAGDPPARIRTLHGEAWRVRSALPFAGLGMGLLAGPIQGAVLCIAGFVLVVRAEFRRSRDAEPRAGAGDTAQGSVGV